MSRRERLAIITVALVALGATGVVLGILASRDDTRQLYGVVATTCPTSTVKKPCVVLVWKKPATNGGATITSYRIYRATVTSPLQAYTRVTPRTVYTDTGVLRTRTYSYRVSAINKVGEGAKSNLKSATIP